MSEEEEATIPSNPNADKLSRGLLNAHLDSPAEPATYKHQPLDKSVDEIRLLKLHKDKEGPVHCEVKVFPLDSAPEYIALSYRWGPPLPLHNLFIGDKALKIRDILNSCLLELREDVDTWLWIDQICIAQTDTTERNHQVGMMSRIYSNGTSVIIWLGDIALAAPGEIDRFNDQDLDRESVLVLLENTYFTRLWIVQEIILARRVKIRINGGRCVAWSKLQAAYLSLGEFRFRSNFPAQYLCHISNRDSEQDRYRPLCLCIPYFLKSDCEDPRDRVYSLMGVVKEKDRITVDYNKTVLEVYLDVLNVLINDPTLVYNSEGFSISYSRGLAPLYQLGVEMGLGEPEMEGMLLLLHDRFGRIGQQTVSTVGFEKADCVQEHDHWWCVYNGERVLYPCPPT
jgi:hypothetical protein